MEKIIKKDLDLYNRYSKSIEKQIYYKKIDSITLYSAYDSGFYGVKELLDNLGDNIVFRFETLDYGDNDSKIVFYEKVEESEDLYKTRMKYLEDEKERLLRLKEKQKLRASKAQEKKYQRYLELKKEFG